MADGRTWEIGQSCVDSWRDGRRLDVRLNSCEFSYDELARGRRWETGTTCIVARTFV